MRGILLALAVTLLAPAAGALFPPPLAEHWEVPPGAAPQLTPPNPAVRSSAPHVRQGPLVLPPSPMQTSGTARVLVLLIRFTDVAPDPAHSGSYFDGRMNGPGGSVQAYYEEVSR
ncbi:MAG: hypothetical protein E6K19_04915, partial [Methanobacteriota archaeon]